jgi:hypothetical protein
LSSDIKRVPISGFTKFDDPVTMDAAKAGLSHLSEAGGVAGGSFSIAVWVDTSMLFSDDAEGTFEEVSG